MKFNVYAPYLFLVLLAFAQIADTSSVTKSARNRLQSLSRSRARSTRRANTRSTTKVKTMNAEDAGTLIDLFKDIIKTPDLIFDMVMGFVCEHVSIICTIYKKIRDAQTYYTQVKSCFAKIKDTVEDIGVAKTSIQAIETQGDQRNGDFDLCQLIKTEIAKTYRDNIQQAGRLINQSAGGLLPTGIINWTMGVGSFITQPFASATTMCFSLGGGRVAELEGKFGTMARYSEQCNFFAKKNCRDFDPATKNLTSFFKKAWNAFKGIYDSVKCIVEVIQATPGLADVFNALATWIGASVASAAVSVLGNALTMGIWGGIKAAYYIVLLGLKIHKFIQDWNAGTRNVFVLGGIIANAISIVKSLIGGRRRYRKLKK